MARGSGEEEDTLGGAVLPLVSPMRGIEGPRKQPVNSDTQLPSSPCINRCSVNVPSRRSSAPSSPLQNLAHISVTATNPGPSMHEWWSAITKVMPSRTRLACTVITGVCFPSGPCSDDNTISYLRNASRGKYCFRSLV